MTSSIRPCFTGKSVPKYEALKMVVLIIKFCQRVVSQMSERSPFAHLESLANLSRAARPTELVKVATIELEPEFGKLASVRMVANEAEITSVARPLPA